VDILGGEMKIYILESESSIYVVNTVLESSKFWLVPVHNSNLYDMYGKDVFTLTVEEVQEVKK
jgi:hypothetical protein